MTARIAGAVSVVVVTALASLLAPGRPAWVSAASPARDSAVLTATERAADFYRPTLAHTNNEPINGWSWSTYASGVLALSRQVGESRYLGDAMTWGAANDWRLGAASEADPDTTKAAQVYYDLHAIDPGVPLTAADDVMREDLTAMLASQYDWADGLFMGLPSWARWAERTGDPAYLDKLDTLYLWERDRGARSPRCASRPVPQDGLFDPAQGLWYRDCRFVGARDANGRPIFWARGNGWVMAAMAQVIDALPAHDPRATKYADMLETMAARLVQLQGRDGLWRSSLLDGPLHPQPETSSTSLISYALAYGIRTGLLDATTYLPAVVRAWRGLTSISLRPSGFITNCQGVSTGPTASYSARAPRVAPTPTSAGSVNYDSPPFCVGSFLLAGTEIAKLFGDGDITTRESASRLRQAITVDLGAWHVPGNAAVAPSHASIDPRARSRAPSRPRTAPPSARP
ncbi:MAG TPA: glycoside hydrolase family 88 protein [Mycobacterium sp.]|nr:glycoside hydrolase family 88 protein [Mycobacterium sp.]